MKPTESIESLLDKAYDSDDPDTVRRLAERVLKLDPENMEGMILLSDVTDDPERKITLLERLKCMLGDCLDEDEQDAGQEFIYSETGMLYVSVLLRLAFALFSEGFLGRALDVSQEAMGYDADEVTPAKILFYRTLLEMKEYRRVLEEGMKETDPSAGTLHAIAIATFKLFGAGRRAYDALWAAVDADPEVPFYIMGYLDEPEDDADDDIIETFNLAMLYEDAWLSGDDIKLGNWLASATILLGLALSLFAGEEEEKMLVLADALGVGGQVEDIMVNLESRDDWRLLSEMERWSTAIKLLSEGSYLPLDE